MMMAARGLMLSKYYFRTFVQHYFQERNFKVDKLSAFQMLSSSTLYQGTSIEKDRSFSHIVWLDMEMTGLDLNVHHILEIACIITNKDLEVVAKPLNIVIHQSEKILDNMNAWCQTTHRLTGLIDEVRMSKITLENTNQILLNYLKMHVKENNCPLAGNSVFYDRMFLQKYMPEINNYLHYRNIDISSIKELINVWNINIPVVKKRNIHRALQDIEESIKELQHYKKYIFNPCIECNSSCR